jgi:transposase
LKRYFRCIPCKRSFFECFSFESPFGYYTTHFEKYIQWNWGFVSGNKLTELYQSSNSVIYSILERIDVGLLNERGMRIIAELDEIYLGVDEHSFSGHDMVLVITELKTKQVLAILPGITKEILEKWIWSIPLEHHKKIK